MVLHLNAERVSTYVHCPLVKRLILSFSESMIDGLSLQLTLVIVCRPLCSAAHLVTSSTFLNLVNTWNHWYYLKCQFVYLVTSIFIDDSDDTDTIAFADLSESLCLAQHVKSPTHVMGHILDLIIARSPDNIIKGSPSLDSFLSDHCSVLYCLNVTKVL